MISDNIWLKQAEKLHQEIILSRNSRIQDEVLLLAAYEHIYCPWNIKQLILMTVILDIRASPNLNLSLFKITTCPL